MTKKLARTALVLAALLIAAAYGSAFRADGVAEWAPWALALGSPLAFVALMVLGAARNGRIGSLAWPFALVFVVLAGGFVWVLLRPPADPTAPELWLGLPPRAAIVLYGIGLVPMLLVPVAYALTFDEMTLSDADLERVRRAAARRRAETVERAARAAVRGRPVADDAVGPELDEG